MKSLKKIGTLAAGAIMLGSVLSGGVSAGLNETGMSEGFFYDTNYNPIVQIVVGNGGLASDSVAAGNIAAVIGNLAYSTSQRTIGIDPTATGRVVLGVSAKGAAGKYEQADHGGVFENYIGNGVSMIGFDSNSQEQSTSVPSSFYDDNQGLNWTHDDSQTYEPGEFVTYSLACESQRSDSGILKETTVGNIHCFFCETLCLEQLENPEHTMSESITVNLPAIRWYEDGIGNKDDEVLTIKLPAKSVSYKVDTECIPMAKISRDGDAVDFEWRGKFLLLGEEYYVKNIKGHDKIFMAKGKVLNGITSEGYATEYLGYKFKIDHLIYSAEFTVSGILMDVEKPDGTVIQTQISKLANGVVDDIEIAGIYAEESDGSSVADILVYDATSTVLLENGKDIELGGSVKKNWKVAFNEIDAADSEDITEYEDATGTCLDSVTLTYKSSTELEEGESLDFPSTFKLSYNGYMTDNFKQSECSGAGEGNILFTKEDSYKLYVSFTGDDGQRYDNVGMFQGPYTEGETFMLGGSAFKYESADEITDGDCDTVELYLKDVLNGGKDKYVLTAYTGDNIDLTTVAFENAEEDDETTTIETENDCDDTSVFYAQNIAGAGGVTLLYNDGEIYFVQSVGSGNNVTISDQTIGVLGKSGTGSGQVGTGFDSFEEDGNKLILSVISDSTSDLNGDGQNDTLVKLQNEKGEVAVIDIYDRDRNSDSSSDYENSVIGTDTVTWSDTTGAIPSHVGAKLDSDKDMLMVLPDGGDKITVTYGSDNRIDEVSVCHPQDEVFSTIFIGTTEEETMLEAVITKDDEGKEQSVGCCTYTVKEFSVGATAVSQTVTEVNVNSISGGLVVSEDNADLSRNLIIVGGPVVNGLTTVTADEIGASEGRYIVKNNGKRVIVAGYESSDTVAAGNALISWLKTNVH